MIGTLTGLPTFVQEGKTLLHWAAKEGYVDVLEALLEHGADPKAVDKVGGEVERNECRMKEGGEQIRPPAGY